MGSIANTILGAPNSSATAQNQTEPIAPSPNNTPAQAVQNTKRPYLASAGVCLTGGQDSNSLPAKTVTISSAVSGYGLFDQLVQLGFQCRRLMISSIGATVAEQAYNVCLSLAPTGIQSSQSAPYVAQGNEAWIPICNVDQTLELDIAGTIIEFANPISRIYVQLPGMPTGTAEPSFTITFMGADDICKIEWKPQLATTT